MNFMWHIGKCNLINNRPESVRNYVFYYFKVPQIKMNITTNYIKNLIVTPKYIRNCKMVSYVTRVVATLLGLKRGILLIEIWTPHIPNTYTPPCSTLHANTQFGYLIMTWHRLCNRGVAVVIQVVTSPMATIILHPQKKVQQSNITEF